MATTVIRDAALVDGTGAPQRPADIVIKDGRIAEITPALKASTAQVGSTCTRITTHKQHGIHG